METKEIIDVPAKGTRYWYVRINPYYGIYEVMAEKWNNSVFDRHRVIEGKCFLVKSYADEYCNVLNNRLLQYAVSRIRLFKDELIIIGRN